MKSCESGKLSEDGGRAVNKSAETGDKVRERGRGDSEERMLGWESDGARARLYDVMVGDGSEQVPWKRTLNLGDWSKRIGMERPMGNLV